jgi:hypothetical protein
MAQHTKFLTPSRSAVSSNSIYTRWHLVYRDLVAIADRAGPSGIAPGHQDIWLFLASTALSWFAHTDTLEHEILAQAQVWVKNGQWTERDVLLKMRPVIQRATAVSGGNHCEWNGKLVDPRYRFRRNTLWNLCRGMVPADLIPELRAIIPDEIAAKRQLERDRARYGGSYSGYGVRVENEQKFVMARILRSQGRSLREIAKELAVGKDTVRKWTS